MLQNLAPSFSHKLNKSLKDSLSRADFMPGSVCFFMFNHRDKEVFCHFNTEYFESQNVTFERKLSFTQFLKKIHNEDFRQFLTHQRRIIQNYDVWLQKGKHDLKIVQEVRLKVSEQKSIRLLIQQKTISHQTNKLEWSIGSCTDISHIKDDGELSMVVFSSQGERLAFEKVTGSSNKELLTEREIDVLKLLAKGYKSKDINQILHISLHTVRTHRRNILKKTNLKSTTQLLNFATKSGILKPDY